MAMVDHVHCHHALLRVVAGPQAHDTPSGRRILHRLDGVARQVQQHLLDHHGVGAQQRQVRRQLFLDGDIVFARLQVDQRADAVDQGADGDILALRFALAHEIVHAADDLAGPLRLRAGLFQRRFQGSRFDGRAAVDGAADQVQRARRVAGNGRQRLIQFMRQHRRQFAHGGQA